MTQLRLTLEKQRDDIGKSFRQILFSNTRKSNYNTDSNTDDDIDESDSEQEIDYIDDNNEEGDLNGPHPKSSTRKRSDSSNTTGVAPVSLPSTCAQIEDLRDPFVKALTKRYSLTQLHEWLRSIKSSVSNSVTVVTSHHLHLHITSQLTVTELLSTLPFSTQLNRGHHHLAWSGFAKYENFKPWKTKQSFHPRHPHCWFAPSPQLQQIHLRSTTAQQALH